MLLLLTSTLVDYFAGLMMGRAPSRRKRTKYLVISLVSNLGLLFFFKYYDFFSDSLTSFFGLFHCPVQPPELNLLLPIGISFYTFQTLSYSIDVYRGRQKPERHLGRFALFVSFFPQLVAGPIERSRNLLPQFLRKINFDYVRVTDGLKLMAWGLFKKVVIADRLAVLVDTVYNNPADLTGVHFVVATVFFAFQIYCDFSGYSDIAIGGARVLGFDLMDNFNRPYSSRSTSEFWKRWHISLSSWFRDYLYIPLGGSRVRIPRWCFNIAVVFLISGFWHGANWTFVIWGGLHGFYLLFGAATGGVRRKIARRLMLHRIPGLQKTAALLVTFILVTFAWIFFRANNVSDALHIVSRLPVGWNALLSVEGMRAVFLQMGMGRVSFIIAIMSIFFMELVHYVERHRNMRTMLSDRPAWVRWPFYIILVLAIINLGGMNAVPFIYFAF